MLMLAVAPEEISVTIEQFVWFLQYLHKNTKTGHKKQLTKALRAHEYVIRIY